MSNLPHEPEFEQAYNGMLYTQSLMVIAKHILIYISTTRAGLHPPELHSLPEEPRIPQGSGRRLRP